MFDESLHIAAAAYAAGWISGDELKIAANRALDHGIYTHRLGELATLSNPILSDARPLFETALRELGMPIPTKQEGCTIAAAACVRAILEGAIAPAAGVTKLHELAFEEVYRNGSLDPASRDALCEAEVLFYEYDYRDYHPLAEIDRRVLESVAAWSLKYGRRTVNPLWLTWNNATVPAIAQRICDERTFHDLPILADALEEAGCTNPEILGHCRGGGEHVRGCWVVDLILGKT